MSRLSQCWLYPAAPLLSPCYSQLGWERGNTASRLGACDSPASCTRSVFRRLGLCEPYLLQCDKKWRLTSSALGGSTCLSALSWIHSGSRSSECQRTWLGIPNSGKRGGKVSIFWASVSSFLKKIIHPPSVCCLRRRHFHTQFLEAHLHAGNLSSAEKMYISRASNGEQSTEVTPNKCLVSHQGDALEGDWLEQKAQNQSLKIDCKTVIYCSFIVCKLNGPAPRIYKYLRSCVSSSNREVTVVAQISFQYFSFFCQGRYFHCFEILVIFCCIVCIGWLIIGSALS